MKEIEIKKLFPEFSISENENKEEIFENFKEKKENLGLKISPLKNLNMITTNNSVMHIPIIQYSFFIILILIAKSAEFFRRGRRVFLLFLILLCALCAIFFAVKS